MIYRNTYKVSCGQKSRLIPLFSGPRPSVTSLLLVTLFFCVSFTPDLLLTTPELVCMHFCITSMLPLRKNLLGSKLQTAGFVVFWWTVYCIALTGIHCMGSGVPIPAKSNSWVVVLLHGVVFWWTQYCIAHDRDTLQRGRVSQFQLSPTVGW